MGTRGSEIERADQQLSEYLYVCMLVCVRGCGCVCVDAGVCFQSITLSVEHESCALNENMVTVSKHRSLLIHISALDCHLILTLAIKDQSVVFILSSQTMRYFLF